MKTAAQFGVTGQNAHRATRIMLSLTFIFAVAVALPAQTKYVLLHTFSGGPNDGQGPDGTPILDSSGNLYGTTFYGGPDGNSDKYSGFGTVYKVSKPGQETVLHGFTGSPDGSWPVAGVIRDSAGNLYGTTLYDASGVNGNVYKLEQSGSYTEVCSIPPGADGEFPWPMAGVTRDSAGNLYGTGLIGGAFDAGEAYKCEPDGHVDVLYSFSGGTNGSYPFGSLTGDSSGNLYGTTSNTSSNGPSMDCIGSGGTVFKLAKSGELSILYTFSGGSDGSSPCSGVIRDSAGNLYGTTRYGGLNAGGVVYKVDSSGQETVLYNFCSQPNCTDGNGPIAGVIRDSAGNLYGTTYSGGHSGYGVVYKIDTLGNETVLHAFTGGKDGASPYAGIVRDSAGNLYGAASSGGTYDFGVVFKLEK
jgi:uncharacterized repeat protein (TIGR03803 family)